jgi:mono/diheme cytochrome c family protein
MSRPHVSALAPVIVTVLASALALGSAACSSSSEPEIVHGSAVDHGRALFDDPTTSSSASNTFTCATCHRQDASSPGPTRLDPGAVLGGVTSRKTFWGGQRVDLLESINDCRSFFMDARTPWTTDDEDARAMYAFLAQLAPAAPASLPFTVVENPVDLSSGDAKRGALAYDLACKTCHGAVHEGAGKLATFIPVLPDEVVRTHAPLSLSPAQLRLVFVTKARLGAFRGGGSMPPFSREVLADDDLAGILAFFGLD